MKHALLLGTVLVLLSGSCRDYDSLWPESSAAESPAQTDGGTSSSAATGGVSARADATAAAGERGDESSSAAGAGQVHGMGGATAGEAPSEPPYTEPGSSGTGPNQGTSERSLGALAELPEELATRRVAPPNVPNLPSEHDLSSQMPAPGNQGSERSAVAWAAAALKTFLTAERYEWSVFSPRYQFSPAWIYSQIAGGSDGGARPSEALDLLVSDGADTLLFFPQRSRSWSARPDYDSIRRAARFKATHWGTLSPEPTVLKRSLAANQPVMLAFEVHPDFDVLSDANWLYDDLSGPSRGRYAAVVVGFDDDKAAFKLLSSWGADWGQAGFGWLAYDLVDQAGLGAEAYVLSDGRVTPPEITPNLYMVENGKLWRADANYGDYVGFGREEWVGSDAIVTLGGSLFIVQGEWLHRVNPGTGTFSTVGSELSGGTKLLTTLHGSLYLSDGGALWRIADFSSGYRERVGSADLSRATALAATADALFVVQDGSLARVTPETGELSALGDPIFYGRAWLAAVNESMYLMNGGALWVIDDLATGSARRLGQEDWSNGSALAAHAGALYVIRDSQLWLVDTQSGASEALHNASWTVDPILMAGMP
jgi:hypothetical protein